MREKLIKICQSLIDESSLNIHEACLSVFYTKEEKFDYKNIIDENLVKLDFAREILTLLSRMEYKDFYDVLQEYIDGQIGLYKKEINSKDSLKRCVGENRKKILDFFVVNFYKR